MALDYLAEEDKTTAARRRWRLSRDWVLLKLYEVKHRAKSQGVEFTLTYDDFPNPLPTHCPVLGLELQYNGGNGNNNNATIDRIDPTKGYVSGNVRIISWRANRLKSNATHEELEKLHIDSLHIQGRLL